MFRLLADIKIIKCYIVGIAKYYVENFLEYGIIHTNGGLSFARY